MRVRMTVRTLYHSFIISICILLLLTPTLASAEYYFWYPEPVQNIIEYHGTRHHHYWAVHHGYFYDDCYAFPAFAAYPVYVERVVYRHAPPRRVHVVKPHRARHHYRHAYNLSMHERCYDPDLATSDDNPCVNPNMNIDY